MRVLDLRGLTIVADYFVIASADSTVQVRSITEAIVEALEEAGAKPPRREGWNDARWVLLDYGDVVVHIFHQADREYYDLERRWSDAPVLQVAASGIGLSSRGPLEQ